jgi:hypothetical protein
MIIRLVASMSTCGALLVLAAPSPAAENAPEPPAPALAAEPTAAEPAQQKQGFSASLEAGKEWRWLYGIPIDGYDFRATFAPGAVLHRHFLPAVFTSVMLAQTETGLGVNHVVIGGRLEARARYFYVGMSAGLGYFWVNRADGGAMGNADGLLDLFLGPQLPLGDHFALALEGRFSAELLPGQDNTVAYGPGLALRAIFH